MAKRSAKRENNFLSKSTTSRPTGSKPQFSTTNGKSTIKYLGAVVVNNGGLLLVDKGGKLYGKVFDVTLTPLEMELRPWVHFGRP
jgi:hypothetical protein